MSPTTRASARRNISQVVSRPESDYGSDIDLDDGDIIDLLALADPESQPLQTIESIEEHNPLPTAARVPLQTEEAFNRRRLRTLVDEHGVSFQVPDIDAPLRAPSVEVEYHAANRIAFETSPDSNHSRQASPPSVPDDPSDTRSPLERFRTPPKKPMSVTDMVSPAWCELQYFYSLSKYGRVQKTPAMRQGSSVHKVLEEQVHVTVPVDVETREDRFGLRIWNIIQGLRTLRTTGMTREMEVWGIVEGQVVNGIIDELSYTCPDSALEAGLLQKKKRGRQSKSSAIDSADQTTMDSFLGANSSSSPAPAKARPVYITDVKTRGSNYMPKDEVSLRPTYMQLMLYRRLLGQLSSGSTPPEQIFARYKVDGDVPFSDTFLAQIGGLDYSQHKPPNGEEVQPPGSTQYSMEELRSHNTLQRLWSLMTDEFAQTITKAIGPAKPIGDILAAEFRSASSGDILGTKVFLNDEKRLDLYIRDEMAWWKGERPAKGVDIEEAFKCRICSFASTCSWRETKVEEGVQKARLRREGRVKSEV